MTQTALNCIEINPKNPAKASVIWLHGLGATSDDFVPIVPELNLAESLGVRFVFPQAPMHPITINSGMTMPAWFDIKSLDGTAEEDAQGIQNTQQLVEQLIAHEKQLGIPSHKIILAGFSQGGAMALHTGLRHAEPLAGILALSCYLPLASKLVTECTDANRNIPIFMAHGKEDTLVLWQWADFSRSFLENSGYSVKFKTYPMAHTVCEEEVADIGEWIIELIGTD